MSEPSVIVAVDFDGILVHDKFPAIGAPVYSVISFVRQMQDAGVETVLWTSRVDQRLAEAVSWCEDRGLHFSAINAAATSNLRKYTTDPRKIYADIYLDNATPCFQWFAHTMGYEAAITDLLRDAKRVLELKGVKL